MKLKEKQKMFVKGISTEDFPKNCLRESSNISLRMRTMTVSERYPAIRLGGQSNILPKLGSKFSRTKSFCFENCDFTHILLRHM